MLRTSLLTLLALSLSAQDAPKPAPTPAPAAEAKPDTAAAPKTEIKPTQAPAPKAETAPAAKVEGESLSGKLAKPRPVRDGGKPAAPVAAKLADKVIAKIGDRLVWQSEVDAAIAAMPPQQQQQVTMVQGAKEQYAKSFVDMQLLAAKARKDGMDKTEAYKRKAETALTQVLATEILAKEGPALQAKMVVKDEDVKAFYDKNKGQFMTPEKFSARHILVSVKSERAPTGLSEEDAKAKVAKVEEALKAGKKFEDVAKEFSDDPGSKDKGGLYENITFGQFVPEFEKAVRFQEVGKLGSAIRTPFGFHLIQVEKIIPAEQEPFETSKEKAQAAATKERQEVVWNEFLKVIKAEIPFQFGGEIAASAPKPVAAAKPAKKATK
jgi:peptidyl-prolyl cis-trans isomerase C